MNHGLRALIGIHPNDAPAEFIELREAEDFADRGHSVACFGDVLRNVESFDGIACVQLVDALNPPLRDVNPPQSVVDEHHRLGKVGGLRRIDHGRERSQPAFEHTTVVHHHARRPGDGTRRGDGDDKARHNGARRTAG
ncbi:MAG: hypothetical protein QM775_14025 [Pirellulales bacterium]